MGFSNLNKPKRSLGQNFFVNANLGRKFVEKTLETNPQKIIEIGPGRGFFTQLFVEKDVDVSAIEKDSELSKNLAVLFPNVEVFNEDVFSKEVLPLFQNTKDTVCFGSLPYNIAKRIVSFLGKSSNIENCYFIIQKEVAQKYVSNKKSSVLSLSTRLYFDSTLLSNISPENFKPRPNVVSSFIKFSRNKNLELMDNPEEFLKYLYIAFKQPRKKLKNNLHKKYDISLEEDDLLNKRAEDFNFEEHLNIFQRLKQMVV